MKVDNWIRWWSFYLQIVALHLMLMKRRIYCVRTCNFSSLNCWYLVIGLLRFSGFAKNFYCAPSTTSRRASFYLSMQRLGW